MAGSESSQNVTIQAFTAMDVLELVMWLREHGIPQETCEKFDGKCTIFIFYHKGIYHNLCIV